MNASGRKIDRWDLFDNSHLAQPRRGVAAHAPALMGVLGDANRWTPRWMGLALRLRPRFRAGGSGPARDISFVPRTVHRGAMT